jgi:hypothetical protein
VRERVEIVEVAWRERLEPQLRRRRAGQSFATGR